MDCLHLSILALSTVIQIKFSSYFIISTFSAIIFVIIPSEGLFTKLSAVNARTKTIRTLYYLARNTPGHVSKESNISASPDDESEQTIDMDTKNSICLSILDRASEFGGDVFEASGEVFDEFRCKCSVDVQVGVKVLALHLKENVTLNRMTPEKWQLIRGNVSKPKKGENLNGCDLSSTSDESWANVQQFSSVESLMQPVLVYSSKTDKWLIPEDVFTCMRRIDGVKIEMYFVSKEYNVNFASDSRTNPIVARFLFIRDMRGLSLHAVAEEPAKPVLESDSEVDIEDLYIERRMGKHPAKSASEDRICRLNDRERFRLCGLIFNSEYFEDKLRFPASYSVVEDYQCQENTVTLQRRVETEGKLHKEWMALCYISYSPFKHDPDPRKTYFVSQAYKHDTNNTIRSNDIFLYGLENGEIFLINSFTNIRLDRIMENM